MLEPFKDNLDRGQEEEDPGLKCKDCQDAQDKPPAARDSQVHCLVCPAWTYLREDLDLTDFFLHRGHVCLFPKSDGSYRSNE